MPGEFDRQLNRIAEVQFILRPILIQALRSFTLSDDARKVVGGYST
jgi:hypothetical protein